MNTACAVAGCPRFTVPGGRGRCAIHRRTTSERGYGRAHQFVRRRLEMRLPAPCIYACGRILQRGDRWVAAHFDDRDSSSPRGVACEPCNQKAKDGQLRPAMVVI